VLLAFGGIALLTHPGSLGELNRGDLLTLAGALGFAAHIVALSRFAVRVPWRELAALQLAFAFAFSLPLALLAESPPVAAPPSVWAAVLFLGVFCSAFAFLAQTWAQRHTTTTRVALILALEPVFAALFSVLALGERLSAGEWAGGGLVVAGVILAEVGGRREGAERAERAL
jgi:drug/metabolite transporter (DMT)-like permease